MSDIDTICPYHRSLYLSIYKKMLKGQWFRVLKGVHDATDS